MSNKRKAKYCVLGAILCFLFIIVLIIPHNLIKNNGPYSYAVYDRNNVFKLWRRKIQVHIRRRTVIILAADEQWRFKPCPVPEKFKKAIIAYEDKRFYWHAGVDLISIGRAIVYNHKAGRIVSGGSTITMQTVRILEHNPKLKT